MVDTRFRQMRDLFHRAFDLPAGEPQSLLSSECGDDVELRAELQALLDEVERSAGFLPRRGGGAVR